MSSHSAAGLPLSIPDRNYQGISVPIEVGGELFVRDIDVRVDITHSFNADLVLALVSPYGRTVTLSAGNGGSGDNYTGTIFDEEADQWIFNGKAPFTNRYKPEESFLPLYGGSASGMWQLWVVDYQLFDVGTLNSYSIDLQTAACTFIGQKHYLPQLLGERQEQP
jgi:subtilisin-like proprotein convertase family protein